MPGFEFFIGLQVIEANATKVVGEIEVVDHHLQPYGMVHGGVFCSIIETLASYGAVMWANEQGWYGAVGLSNTTDFIRATREGILRAEAIPVHQGRNQQIWQVIVTRSGDGKVAARGQVRLHNVLDVGDIASPVPA